MFWHSRRHLIKSSCTVVFCTALKGNFALYLALYKFCLTINDNNDNSNSIHPDANCRFQPVFLFDIFFIYVTLWLIYYLNDNSACVYFLTVCVRVFYLNTCIWTSTDIPCNSDSITCLTTSPDKTKSYTGLALTVKPLNGSDDRTQLSLVYYNICYSVLVERK